MSILGFKDYIKDHNDFPKKGIVFKDWLPILTKPEVFEGLIDQISGWQEFSNADAIIAIDARGFIFGSCIAFKLSKPLVLARKPGKLPGNLMTKSYDLEYGKNELSIQKDCLDQFDNYLIIDDLLATGGTVKSVAEILKEANKKIIGLSVLIELVGLKGRHKFDFPVQSLIEY